MEKKLMDILTFWLENINTILSYYPLNYQGNSCQIELSRKQYLAYMWRAPLTHAVSCLFSQLNTVPGEIQRQPENNKTMILGKESTNVYTQMYNVSIEQTQNIKSMDLF